MYAPNLNQEKCGMVWVGIKVVQEIMMNNTKCQRYLEWTSTWDRKDGIHHYSYRKTTSDQHCLSYDIPDMDSQV
jgi:hypothetical protein